MKILVIGGGGREHTLVWKIAQSPLVEKIYCAPGNAGTAELAENVDIPADDVQQLMRFARREAIDLTVVGPEAPLVGGLVDRFEAQGLLAFGPSQRAAELEGSKVFAKYIMRKHGIPSARYDVFETIDAAEEHLRKAVFPEPFGSATQAEEFLRTASMPVALKLEGAADDEAPIVRSRRPQAVDAARNLLAKGGAGSRVVIEGRCVVKADGLAAGKGVFVCQSADEAREAIYRIMRLRVFGDAGNRVVIEECLVGEEASILALTDGKTILPLPTSQDHKPALDNDAGPNTGGMGAYSPAPVVTDAQCERIEREVIIPIVHAMNREDRLYRGVVYAGLMMTDDGPRVLEFNARFGDPETQPILFRLKGDIVPVLKAIAEGKLDEAPPLEWDPRPAVCVVMASGGYPGKYAKGKVITGLAEAAALPDTMVFHAGTALKDGKVVTSGGRVLGVTAMGDDIQGAIDRAYQAVEAIHFAGAHYRTDIGAKAKRHLA